MNQLGYYGKTPQRGDFVRFNLPALFVKVWDDWLQQLMINGENTFDTRWPDLYHAAPSYRFALSSGIAGESAWIGVVAPGKDKVGRRFPFCLARSLPADASLLPAVHQQKAWYEDAERLVRKILTAETDFDSVQDQMQDLLEKHAMQCSSALLNAVPPLTDNSVALLVNQRQALSHHAACLSVLNASLIQTHGYFSIWQACDNADHCLLSSGLPDDSCALALFSQQWNKAQVSLLDVSDQMAIDSTMKPYKASPTNNKTSVAAIHNSDTVPHLGNSRAEVQLHARDVSPESDSYNDGTLTTAEITEAIKTSEVPSADDWAALDDFRGNEAETPVLPEAEKLELDEDESSTAPWET